MLAGKKTTEPRPHLDRTAQGQQASIVDPLRHGGRRIKLLNSLGGRCTRLQGVHGGPPEWRNQTRGQQRTYGLELERVAVE